MVVMGEIINKFEDIILKLKDHHIDKIELLGYHALGKNKYEELGKCFHPFTSLNKEELESCIAALFKQKVKASYLSV